MQEAKTCDLSLEHCIEWVCRTLNEMHNAYNAPNRIQKTTELNNIWLKYKKNSLQSLDISISVLHIQVYRISSLG